MDFKLVQSRNLKDVIAEDNKNVIIRDGIKYDYRRDKHVVRSYIHSGELFVFMVNSYYRHNNPRYTTWVELSFRSITERNFSGSVQNFIISPQDVDKDSAYINFFKEAEKFAAQGGYI